MCDGMIAWTLVDFGAPFQCVYCKDTVRVSRGYLTLTGVLDLIVAVLLCLAAGIRGYWLIPAIAAGFALVGLLSAFLYRRFWPPPLEYVPERERYTSRAGWLI